MMKRLHLILILLSSILLFSGVFPDALWFDENYTLCLLAQPFGEMAAAASADVHPLFFYLFSKGILILLGQDPAASPETCILILRIVTVLPMCLLSLLGFTHVRRIFGPVCGLLFSLFVGFAPSTFYYAVQIRMYSYAALFVFCAFFAALRIGMDVWESSSSRPPSPVSFGMLALFSLLAGYTHYYALAAAAFVQLFLLLLSWKQKKQLLLPWFFTVLAELLLYIPGFLLLLRQASSVSQGYWITIQYPDIFKEIAAFFHQGAFSLSFALSVSVFFWILLVLSFLICRKHWKTTAKKSALCCALPLAAVCISGLLLSIHRPLFIPRYLFPMCGLYWLMAALILSQISKKWLLFIFGILFGLLGIRQAQIRLSSMTHPENDNWKLEIQQYQTPSDVFFFSDLNVGCQAAVFYADHPLYFYNEFSWKEKNGLRGFSSLIEKNPADLTRDLPSGSRIWIMDSEKTDLASQISSDWSCILPKSYLFHPYSGQWIHLSLWQKDG